MIGFVFAGGQDFFCVFLRIRGGGIRKVASIFPHPCHLLFYVFLWCGEQTNLHLFISPSDIIADTVVKFSAMSAAGSKQRSRLWVSMIWSGYANTADAMSKD